MPNVEYQRQELATMIEIYDFIRDILGGQSAMQKAGVKWLPKINPTDTSVENVARNKAYLERAIFYNFTMKTVRGLVGAIFLREPVIELPDLLNPLIKDADGNGLTLMQLAKLACGHVLPYGRGGLLTDYPDRDGQATTLAEIKSGKVHPTITFYAPWDIINWRTSSDEADESNLNLVVLREMYDEDEDGFETKTYTQYREIRIVGGNVRVQIWRPEKPQARSRVEKKHTVYQSYFILDASGQPLKEIPFIFLGSENNDALIDYPPIYDLAVVNLGHWRNSADFEESCFMVGQPTPVAIGLSEDWVENYLNKRLDLGSRAVIPLPVGADAKLLEAQPNVLVGEAMKHKETQAKKLGAKLIEERKVEKTATEAEIDSGSENSVLMDVVVNVTKGFMTCLQWAAEFVGASPDEIVFELNDNFDLTGLQAEEQRWLIELVAASLLTLEESRIVLRRSGLATLTFEEFQKQVLEDKLLKDQIVPEHLKPKEPAPQTNPTT